MNNDPTDFQHMSAGIDAKNSPSPGKKHPNPNMSPTEGHAHEHQHFTCIRRAWDSKLEPLPFLVGFTKKLSASNAWAYLVRIGCWDTLL